MSQTKAAVKEVTGLLMVLNEDLIAVLIFSIIRAGKLKEMN